MPDVTDPIPDSAPPPIAYATEHTPDVGMNAPITRGDIACIAIRIIGFVAIATALSTFGYDGVIELMNLRGGRSPFLYALAILFIAYFGGGVFLVMKGPALARWLLPRTAISVPHDPGPAAVQLQAIAFSVLGLVLVLWSISSLAGWVFFLLENNARGGVQPAFDIRFRQALPMLINFGTQAALGVWLSFGSKRLAQWWQNLRHPEFRTHEEPPAPNEKEP